MDASERTRRDRAAAALVTLVVFGSVLAAGAVHPPVFLLVSALTIVGAFFVLGRSRTVTSGPVWVLLALAFWSAVQAVPLPAALLSVLAPHNAEVWAESLRPLRETGPTAASISLDPGASLLEAAKWATYAIVFALAERAGRAWGTAFGPLLVFGSAVIVAVVTLAHGLLGAERLFGVYQPRYAVPIWGVAPLLNPNNLSGYLNMGAICGVGLLLTRRRPGDVWAAAGPLPVTLGIALVVASSALAASRAGVIGLALGVLTLVVLASTVRRDRDDARDQLPDPGGLKRYIAPGAAVVAGLGLALLGASRANWQELENTSADKLSMISWTAPVIRDHPWLGIGRGAFETVFPAYRERAGHVVFTHPENFVAQWLVEWGVPVTCLAAAAFAWYFRPSRLGATRNRVALAACVGVGVALVQNLVDLALEVPGVTIAICALLGALGGSARKEPERLTSGSGHHAGATGRWLRKARQPMVAAGVAIPLCGLAVAQGRSTALKEREALHAEYDARAHWEKTDYDAFTGRLRAAMLRHPAEPYFPVLGALAAHKSGADAMPWIGAALERDPMNGRAHLVLAEILVRRGARRQALLHLRLAVEREPYLADRAGQLAVHWARSLDELLNSAPPATGGAVMLLVMARETRDAPVRAKLLDQAVAQDTSYVDARVLRADDLMRAIAERKPPCGPGAAGTCRSRLAAELDGIHRIDPRHCAVPILRGRSLESEDRGQEAVRTLAEGCAACSSPAACQQARVSLAARWGSDGELREAVRALIATACAKAPACAAAHRGVGDVYAGREDWSTAADHYQRAATNDPSADLYLTLAGAAARAGDATRASAALDKAKRLGRNDPAIAERIEKLRQDDQARGVMGGSP